MPLFPPGTSPHRGIATPARRGSRTAPPKASGDGRGSLRFDSLARAALWRTALTGTGGIRVLGSPPQGPCVLVANHSSHADTAALIAALPARCRPVVAAADDHWFTRPVRAWSARTLTGAFPVRRSGGGAADLLAAERFLRDGRVVIVYPEGTRSADGSLARFRSGAARLAAAAGVPLVPAAIEGTRTLLDREGRFRPARVTVRFGIPAEDIASARTQVARLLGAGPGSG
ncbi:lysophospholipid acyltransferase family protein [Nocardiopsis composta]|uniref:1-acyl-sn-glycerol-3-phosphate acyltransferase n=1 Tax=Nocardiopsis composta TaxID=157465 RepID=A0A7W8VG67_9ACTN|nr:lysophospholipid acyltransferase family protein [Nocardiopsis composta]MBB5434694.1 1-acyl-sn-glycerol-3-phosphate acyltransferase [Nocardiopsis composta]